MGWATAYIAKLKNGQTVQFRPRGGSMTGKIESGNCCTIEPVKAEDLQAGDIVMCKVRDLSICTSSKPSKDTGSKSATTGVVSTVGSVRTAFTASAFGSRSEDAIHDDESTPKLA